jgi:hypothetical protein
MGIDMRKSLKSLLSAGIVALGTGAVLSASADPAEARTRIFLGIGLPLIYLGPPAYYYPPPPPPYYSPYYHPAPAYAPPTYAPPPPPPQRQCRARYDWRWDGYQWRQAYIGCW